MTTTPVYQSSPDAHSSDMFRWTRLRLSHADVTKSDPNSSEDANDPFEDGSSGIVGTLNPTTATPDPGDALGWTWPAFAVDGSRLKGGDLSLWQVLLTAITTPDFSDEDVYVALGLCQQADLTSAGLDAAGVMLTYGDGVVQAGGLVVISGSVTTVVGSGTVGASQTEVVRGTARKHDVWQISMEAYQGDGSRKSVADRAGPGGVSFADDAELHWFVAMGRESDVSGAGTNQTIEFAPRVYAAPPPRGGIVTP